MLQVLAFLLGLLALGFLYEQLSRRQDQRLPLPGRLIEMGRYRLHITDEGTGSATVVVLHGAGDCSYSWIPVRREIARFARVLSYDRPGVGSSAPGPAPDAIRSVDELDSLLTRAGVPGPYILVGHSLGGVIARLYAIRYPERVAGMVMVDSTHEGLLEDRTFWQTFAVLGAIGRVFRALAPFGLYRFMGRVLKVLPFYPELSSYRPHLTPEEYSQFTAIACSNIAGEGGLNEFATSRAVVEEAKRQMTGPGQFGDLPLAVLTNPGFGEAWVTMHRELAARSLNSVHRIAAKKGHSIQMTQPALVIEAVRHVVDQAERRTSRAG